MYSIDYVTLSNIDKHAGGKWLINDTKLHMDNSH